MKTIRLSLSLMLATVLATAGTLAAAAVSEPVQLHEPTAAIAHAWAHPAAVQLQEPSMSYSVSVRAATKAESLAAVAAKFDADVVAHQPSHKMDRDLVLSTATAAVNLLADDETKDVQISLGGSVGWVGGEVPSTLTGVNISVGAFLVTRQG